MQLQPADGAPSVPPRRGPFAGGEGLRLFTFNFLVSCLDIERATLQRAVMARLARLMVVGTSGGTRSTPASPTTRILPRAAHPTAGEGSGGRVLEVQEKIADPRVTGAALDQR